MPVVDFEASPTVAKFIASRAFYNLICGPRGGGKCLRIGTEVLMADGQVRYVEDIHDGDAVMGDNGTPRYVWHTVRGYAPLYEIMPVKGQPFVVTENHLVSLQHLERHRPGGPLQRRGPGWYGGPRLTRNVYTYIWETVDIPLYRLPPILKRPTGRSAGTFWNTHYLFRSGPLDFDDVPVRIDPYFLGVWLGDGHSHQVAVTTMDAQIEQTVYQTAQEWGLTVRQYRQRNNKATTYHLTVHNSERHRHKDTGQFAYGDNALYCTMQGYGFLVNRGVCGQKCIPDTYKRNSKEVRLELLAGLLDTDGHTNHNGYEITQKNEQLADDIVFIARSLGLAAYKAKTTKSSQNGTVGTYYCVTISGDCDRIPVRIPYKKAQPRQQKKNVLHVGVKAITPVGVGAYAGFELSGNGRFLLGDFTVTHNTSAGLMRSIMLARECPSRFYPLRWAVIRDTRKNIGLTLSKTIKYWLPEPFARWRGKPEEPESCDIYLGKKPYLVHLLHFDFFGINSPADHDRFQSYEASGGIWIEEPCPLRTNQEFLSSGVAESVLATAITCLRAGPAPNVQLTMNPPSADHWVAQLFHLPGYESYADAELEMPPDQIRVRDDIRKNSAIFMMPTGENAAERLTPGYVERNRQILLATGHADLYARLVEGRVGHVDVGLRVTPEFNGAHLATGIQIIPHVPMILAWDFGLFASCIAAQVSPQGYLLIHRAWSRENTGIKQLCEQFVHPWLSLQSVERWWYCGGHEAKEREQSNSEETALKAIMRALGVAQYKPAPVSWSARRQAMKDALTRTPGGIQWVRIDPTGAALLIRALDGGWSYDTNASEQVRNETVPPKGRFSHIGDAFAALCAVLLRKTDAQARQIERPSTSRTRFPTSVLGYCSTSRTGV